MNRSSKTHNAVRSRHHIPNRPHVELLEDRLPPSKPVGLLLDFPSGGFSDIQLGSVAATSDVLVAQPPLCEPPASISDVTGTFPLPFNAPLVILNNPLLQATVSGQSGTFHAHIVFQPVPAPLPAISDGCKENSRFTVEDFTGSLTLTGPATGALFPGASSIVLATQQTAAGEPISINASLAVHFGTESNKPLLTFHSDTPVNLIVDNVTVGQVHLVQIVGGEIVSIR